VFTPIPLRDQDNDISPLLNKSMVPLVRRKYERTLQDNTYRCKDEGDQSRIVLKLAAIRLMEEDEAQRSSISWQLEAS
jgi:hypothetical protein